MTMRNLTMMTDLYQLTMMDGYFLEGKANDTAVFDVFFRQKDTINYAVFAGLDQAIDYIKNLHFSKEDIDYLRSLGIFDGAFLDYLKDFRFTGDMYSVCEGDIVYPQEPIVIIKAPLIEAQLIETALLNIISHQTLIATKSARIVSAAKGKSVVEFGLRRAQGPDAGIYGARAAIIGGCNGTSNVLTGQMFDIPVKGTHAHSWVMSFDSELDAFRAFARVYPDTCLLLVDTYDTIQGIRNAITVFNELKAAGHKPIGIRLDSGDLAYLSKVARKMLDEAGFPDAIVMASGDIDEYLLASLDNQGAKIDMYGVGTKLITSEDTPSLGGVYKLSAIAKNGGKLVPRMKVSDSMVKVTNPGLKTLYRIYDKKSGMAFADLIALKDEKLDKPLVLTHETERWKTTTLDDYDVRCMLHKIFENGKNVYNSPALSDIVKFAESERAKFWDEYKRIDNPQIYKVNLSDGLYELKHKLLKEHRAKH
ncbi:MAG: nicotinate phosphoribosyltransferase [Clostridiales bacterium]|nr:nicotinate phosphoribosyltransferase [Clostridiales bacterium]